jgi:hypothetical protein
VLFSPGKVSEAGFGSLKKWRQCANWAGQLVGLPQVCKADSLTLGDAGEPVIVSPAPTIQLKKRRE